MAKRGPKIIEIDWNEFDKLCAIQATQAEIAGWFDCSVDTLDRRVQENFGMKFAEVYQQKKGKGKISLRRMQWQSAQSGNPTLLIWLGKQHLEQSDKRELEIDQVSINQNTHRVDPESERIILEHSKSVKEFLEKIKK